MNEAPELKTPAEMAEYYKVNISTFLEWYHKGWIPAEVVAGKVYRFDLLKVREALAARAAAQPKRLVPELVSQKINSHSPINKKP